jgi:hypothetical protein
VLRALECQKADITDVRFVNGPWELFAVDLPASVCRRHVTESIQFLLKAFPNATVSIALQHALHSRITMCFAIAAEDSA